MYNHVLKYIISTDFGCKILMLFADRDSSNQPPWGLIYFLDFFMRAFSRGVLIQGGSNKNFLGSWSYSNWNFLLVNYFFDATHTSNRLFFKGHANWRYLMAAFSFLAL